MHRHLWRLNGPFNYFAGTVLRTVNILSLHEVQTPASTKRGLAHLLTFQGSLRGLIMLHYFSRKRKGLCSGDLRAHGSLPVGKSPSVTLSIAT